MLVLGTNGFGARTFPDGTSAVPGLNLQRKRMILGWRNPYRVGHHHHIGMIHPCPTVSPLSRHVDCVGNHDDFHPSVGANPQWFQIRHHILGMDIEGVRVVRDEALRLGPRVAEVLDCSSHLLLVELMPLQKIGNITNGF